MRYLVFGLLILGVGTWIGYRFAERPPPEDPIRVIVTELKTQAIVEHERSIAVWYKACPEVTGVNPLMFVAWPAKLSYELPLDEVSVVRNGPMLTVRTSALRVDEPALPTESLDYVSTEPILNLVNEQELVNTEMRKASSIARYLATYYVKRDETLYEDVAAQVRALVLRIGSAVDSGITSVEVEIPRPDRRLPKVPPLDLCTGTTAAVNGLPFARNESGRVIPVAFRTTGRGAAAVIYGVESAKGAK